jgi:hypothetical protein
MATVKLTLSADEALVREAKELARERRTSVSAMFARFVAATKSQEAEVEPPLGPLTQRALGLGRLSDDRPKDELLAEALAEKYGVQL